jgi:mannose-6-phosphate isomerase-like protein (cupin superfamily)
LSKRPGLETLTTVKPIHVPSGEGRRLNLLGIPSTIRIQSRDTDGSITVIELRDQPGGGAPLHIHQREDETFHIIEGEYEFTCGDQTFVAGRGATIFGPRGVAHGYRYLGKTPGRILLIATPGGIENWFEEVCALPKQEIPAVIELGGKYGLQFLPPPGV